MKSEQAPSLHKSRSANRVLALLDAVVSTGPIPLTEVATRLEIPISTALRHLRVLDDNGYVTKDEFGRYSVGPTFLRLALAAFQAGPYAELTAAAQPELERLVEVTEESAYLAVRDGSEAVYIATSEGTHAIRHVGWVGRSVPLAGTAVGAALRSDPPAPGSRPEPFLNTGAIESDVTGVVAPILGHGGVIAAFSVLGPADRLQGARLDAASSAVVAAAEVTARRTVDHLGGVVTVRLDGPGVTIADVVAVARDGQPVELTEGAISRMAAARRVVDELASGDAVYGISTGFGALANTQIPPDRRAALQRALIRSHAAGMGDPVEAEVVRAMMFLRARTLAMGASGARPVVAQRLLDLVNAGIVPVVPEHGSLGASGDLAPLAHAALVVMGEGSVIDEAAGMMDGAAALVAAGIEPLELAEKEGLALTNGTDGFLGMVCLAVHDGASLLTSADITTALSVEGLYCTDSAYAADLQALRPHPGQAKSATNLRALLAGSPIIADHREGDDRVQDAYSIRCAPQVHGTARDTLDFVRGVAERELASAIDNPMVLPDGRIASCGNFHGAPVAMAADYLAIALAEVGAIAERRIDRLLDRNRSHGLPPFLADDPGVDSGLMIGQYTAAAMVAENRRLAAPASVDSLPTSAMQEDHVSMGWGTARKLRRVVANVRRILAIELVVAGRAVDLRAPLQAAPGTGAALALLRSVVEGPGPDRALAPELRAATDLIGAPLIAAATAAAGPLV